jgi:Hypoxia induced protein conserved region
MNFFLILLLVVAMAATVFALVKGIIAFLQTTEADLNSDNIGPSESQLRQQKAMRNRVLFQGVAVLIVALLLAVARK